MKMNLILIFSEYDKIKCTCFREKEREIIMSKDWMSQGKLKNKKS